MRLTTTILLFLLVARVTAQEKTSPTQDLRTSVREWVEAMRKIQQEENDWSRDQEVLQNYKEGLQKEIEDLKRQIADARTRKAGAEQESLDQSNQRDRYAAAKDELSAVVRSLEENLATRLPLLPAPLLAEPKVAQGIEDLQRDLRLPVEKRGEGVSKRLLNVINLLSEAEKFQQTVHLRQELHRNSDGREFNMQVIYFGLACAFAVNEDATYALAGRPGADGWKFEDRTDIAPRIQQLLATTTGDQDAAFITLPLSKP